MAAYTKSSLAKCGMRQNFGIYDFHIIFSFHFLIFWDSLKTIVKVPIKGVSSKNKNKRNRQQKKKSKTR